MGKISKYIVLASGLLFCLFLSCPLLADGNTDLTVYRVGDWDLPAHQVIAGQYQHTEKKSPNNAFIPLPTTTGWWRIDLKRDFTTINRPMIYLDAATFADSEVWLPNSNSPVLLSQLRAKQGFGFSPRMQVVDLPGGLKAGQSIYWRIKTGVNSASLPVRILPEQELRAYDVSQSRLQSLIEGTILALILAGFMLSLILWEPIFLILSSTVFFSLLYVLSTNGDMYLSTFITKWDAVFEFQRKIAIILIMLTIYFAYAFLQMARYTPRIAKLQKVCMALLMGLLILSFVPAIQDHNLIPVVGNLIVIACILSGISSSIVLIKLKNRAGKLFLFSWTPLYFLVFWRLYEFALKLPPNEYVSILFPSSFVITAILLYSGLADRVLSYKRDLDRSEKLANIDSVTETYTRRALDDRLRHVAHSSENTGHSLALLFVDIDHFKIINDTYGHAIGDKALKAVAKRIKGVLRFGDVLGRYGGEEFVIGLLETNKKQAHHLAERIRKTISENPFVFESHSFSITISIGVSVLSEGLSGMEAAMQQADRALYQCKQNGRNCVIAYPN